MNQSFKALETQLGLAEYWSGENSKTEAQLIHVQHMAMLGGAPSVRDIQVMTAHTLEHADTYFITEEIATLLLASLDSLPDIPLAEVGAPSPIGFAWVDHYIIEVPFSGEPGYVRICAFSWYRQWNHPATGEPFEEFHFTFFATTSSRQLQVVSSLYWPIGDGWAAPWETKTPAIPDPTKVLSTMRGFVEAFFAFSQQKMAVTDLERAPRVVRRRLERSWQFSEEPVVRVINLRRAEHKGQGGAGDAGAVDWSCRWIVRGHWTHQYYPSQKARRLLWIAAYVKGPDDKPLKRSQVDIFSVNR